jgi:hypothetical protein
MTALNQQVGGDHYSKLAIQPIEYIHGNKIGFAEGNVIKYVTRWRDKGGIADLKKARHFLDLLIELENREEKITALNSGGEWVEDKELPSSGIYGDTGYTEQDMQAATPVDDVEPSFGICHICRESQAESWDLMCSDCAVKAFSNKKIKPNSEWRDYDGKGIPSELIGVKNVNLHLANGGMKIVRSIESIDWVKNPFGIVAWRYSDTPYGKFTEKERPVFDFGTGKVIPPDELIAREMNQSLSCGNYSKGICDNLSKSQADTEARQGNDALDPALVELCSNTTVHADADGWHVHVGNECPVSELRTRVEVEQLGLYGTAIDVAGCIPWGRSMLDPYRVMRWRYANKEQK